MLPIFIQLLFLDIRNPWRAWQAAVYLCSAWLVFRFSQASARQLLGSLSWVVLLGCAGNFYVIFAILQDFNLHIISGTEIFPIWQDGPTGFGGILIQTNLQALFLAIVCITQWYKATITKKYFPFLLTSILPCAGLIATSSRSGILILAFGLIALIFLSQKKQINLIKLSITVGIAALFVLYWHIEKTSAGINDASIIHRFATTGVEARLLIWDMSVRLFLQHPWFGIGAGNLISYGTDGQIATLAHHPDWTAAANAMVGGHQWTHNIILQIFLEWGIIGGMAILGLVGSITLNAKQLWNQRSSQQAESILPSLILLLMILHGMVSIALLQGFFLVLFALYAAALFPLEHANNTHDLKNIAYSRLAFFFLPIFFLFYLWWSFISTEISVEKAVGFPVKSSQFVIPVAEGIDTPWTSRPSLEMYFANLVFHHAKPSIWIGSENFAYRYWFQHQSSLSLRYLILIAHLKNDSYSEKRLIDLFLQAYPASKQAKYLEVHAKEGHVKGESLDIWK